MEPDPQDTLYTVKLLSALRSGDQNQLQKFLNVIAKHDPTSSLSSQANKSGLLSQTTFAPPSSAERDLGAEALNLAVRCASVQTIQFLLAHRSISLNSIYGDKNQSPLHVAVSISRPNVVSLLLSLPFIDDTIKDADGNTARDIAVDVIRSGGSTTHKARECLRILDDCRHALSATYQSLLHVYILTPISSSSASASSSSSPTSPLLSLLQSPRISHINLNYLDDDTGQSIVHAATQRKDLSILEAAVSAGASVLTRNHQGQLPINLCPPPHSKKIGDVDGGVRGFLKTALLKQQGGEVRTSITTPMGVADMGDFPGLKGYLKKYTNVARGYNVRWFVLKGGVLSYFKTPQEESVASRGSISMRSAVLKKSASDPMRFEVMSFGAGLPSSNHPTQKWYLKASHPNEAERWIKELERSVEWSRRSVGNQSMSSSLSLPINRQGNVSSTGISHRSSNAEKDGTDKDSLTGGDEYKSTSSVNRSKPNSQLKYGNTVKSLKKLNNRASSVSTSSQIISGIDDSAYLNLPNGEDGEETDGALIGIHLNLSYSSSSDEDIDVEDSLAKAEEDIDLLGNTILTIMGAIRGEKDGNMEYMDDLSQQVEEYINLSGHIRGKLKSKLEKEKGRGKAWEEAVRSVVNESSQLERELMERAHDGPSHRHVKKKPKTSYSVDNFADGEAQRTVKAKRDSEKAEEKMSVKELVSSLSSQDDEEIPPPPQVVSPTGTERAIALAEDHDEGMGISDEDEFFDAIDSNNLPNLVVPDNLEGVTPQTPTPADGVGRFEPTLTSPLALSTYSPYHHLRTKLDLQPGDMPNTSLWSVLKNSIGKDLTKISFPVHFNEPTSMLQRMAEDMEFSSCLDIATRSIDPHIRIAYVAAFAMSNYSSTIGRIAKPFNPMLSETFEYVRPDKEFRYMSEQVSHHPPISACWAESPRWHYYGEVDAQNKFMGKSFEIRPTGVAHTELIIPSSFVPEALRSNYPPANSTLLSNNKDAYADKVNEHFSWKKVTTNVSGFIMGSPSIDHYGDMVVTNHRTGDQCILTFKPRGWRGRDAYEISGVVRDSSGEIVYEIAGRWNSQLIARRVGSGDGNALSPDHALPPTTIGQMSPTTITSPVPTKEYILLWRNSEKISGSPFNLTPFALTLNDCPESLKMYLCPTDCRLRPDQRAFELGLWDQANELKLQQEDKQRRIRRSREEGSLPRHTPRWFSAVTDGDTGERFWNPSRRVVGEGGESSGLEYWMERERTWNEYMKGSEQVEWKGVEYIFIEEPNLQEMY